MCIHHAGLSALLYGIIPIKMKWLAVLDVVLLCGRRSAGRSDHTDRDHRIAFELYYFLFCNRNLRGHSPKQAARRKKFQKQISRPPESVCRRCKAQMCSVRSYGT